MDRKDQKIPNEDDELDTLAILGNNAYETIDERLRQSKKTCCVMLVDRAMDLASFPWYLQIPSTDASMKSRLRAKCFLRSMPKSRRRAMRAHIVL